MQVLAMDIARNYITRNAFTKYVRENGKASQNHSLAYIRSKIMTTVETRNQIHAIRVLLSSDVELIFIILRKVTQ